MQIGNRFHWLTVALTAQPAILLIERNQLSAAEYLIAHGARWRGLEACAEAVLPAGQATQKQLEMAEGRWAAAESVAPSLRISTTRPPPPGQWVDDATSGVCLLCQNAFGFFRRRHHCRGCGTLCCGDCTTKHTKLETVFTSTGEMLGDMSKIEKVCDSCFNYHSFCERVERRAPSETRSNATEDQGSVDSAPVRRQLLDGAATPVAGGGGADAGADGSDVPSSGATAAAMHESKQLLQNNFEKLAKTRDQSDQMAAEADGFAAMAKKLAEDGRKSSWW